MSEPDWRAANRANWDERVAIHLGPRGYDLADLRSGHGKLHAIEAAELPPVAGKRVLHLQCHFGHDSLVLAQLGADVVGLDFSAPAIAAAQRWRRNWASRRGPASSTVKNGEAQPIARAAPGSFESQIVGIEHIMAGHFGCIGRMANSRVRCSEDSRVRAGMSGSGWRREPVHKLLAFQCNSATGY
jgi:hypothetical protein